MRWTRKPKNKYRNGDRRTITEFALFPIEINKEVRWLEFVSITQKYNLNFYSNTGWWCDIHFNN